MLADNFKDLLQRPMDRKGFLRYVGMGVIALTGIGAIISGLTRDDNKLIANQQDSTSYGASAYGGRD